jgi:hypothetical protein
MSTDEPVVGHMVPNNRIKWVYVTPLAFAPTLPLIRIAFRHKPVLRDRLFFGTIALGLMHGAWLISKSYDAEEATQTRVEAERN